MKVTQNGFLPALSYFLLMHLPQISSASQVPCKSLTYTVYDDTPIVKPTTVTKHETDTTTYTKTITSTAAQYTIPTVCYVSTVTKTAYTTKTYKSTARPVYTTVWKKKYVTSTVTGHCKTTYPHHAAARETAAPAADYEEPIYEENERRWVGSDGDYCPTYTTTNYEHRPTQYYTKYATKTYYTTAYDMYTVTQYPTPPIVTVCGEYRTATAYVTGTKKYTKVYTPAPSTYYKTKTSTVWVTKYPHGCSAAW